MPNNDRLFLNEHCLCPLKPCIADTLLRCGFKPKSKGGSREHLIPVALATSHDFTWERLPEIIWAARLENGDSFGEDSRTKERLQSPRSRQRARALQTRTHERTHTRTEENGMNTKNSPENTRAPDRTQHIREAHYRGGNKRHIIRAHANAGTCKLAHTHTQRRQFGSRVHKPHTAKFATHQPPTTPPAHTHTTIQQP